WVAVVGDGGGGGARAGAGHRDRAAVDAGGVLAAVPVVRAARARLRGFPVGQPAARVGILRVLRDAGRVAAALRAGSPPARRVPHAMATVTALRRVGSREAAPRRSHVARPDRDGDVL